MYEKHLTRSRYWRELNQLLDEIYHRAQSMDLTEKEMAQLAGLGISTVMRLNYRMTRYPHLATVIRLARAVGMEISLGDKEVNRKVG